MNWLSEEFLLGHRGLKQSGCQVSAPLDFGKYRRVGALAADTGKYLGADATGSPRRIGNTLLETGQNHAHSYPRPPPGSATGLGREALLGLLIPGKP
jgi:hypothetical protein